MALCPLSFASFHSLSSLSSFLPFPYSSFPLYPFAVPQVLSPNPARMSGVTLRASQWIRAEPGQQTVTGIFWVDNHAYASRDSAIAEVPDTLWCVLALRHTAMVFLREELAVYGFEPVKELEEVANSGEFAGPIQTTAHTWLSENFCNSALTGAWFFTQNTPETVNPFTTDPVGALNFAILV